MVSPTLVMGSTCSIRKQKIDCRFSSGKAQIQMHGILVMFINKRYLNVQMCAFLGVLSHLISKLKVGRGRLLFIFVILEWVLTVLQSLLANN